jgi:hypothetical protein
MLWYRLMLLLHGLNVFIVNLRLQKASPTILLTIGITYVHHAYFHITLNFVKTKLKQVCAILLQTYSFVEINKCIMRLHLSSISATPLV